MVEIFSENILDLNEFKMDKYLKKAYDWRRFEINQKLLSKDHVYRQMMKKKSTKRDLNSDEKHVMILRYKFSYRV